MADLIDRRIMSMNPAILATVRRTENFITYFWRQDQQATITGVNVMNDCHRSTMRYQGSDGFWIN